MENTDNQLREAIQKTGYTFYRIKSGPYKGLIAVPKKYDETAMELMKIVTNSNYLSNDSEEKINKVADIVYLNSCTSSAFYDSKITEGLEKQGAESNCKLFKKILESIIEEK